MKSGNVSDNFIIVLAVLITVVIAMVIFFASCANVSTSLNIDQIMSKPLYKTPMGFSISDKSYAEEFDRRMLSWGECMVFQYNYAGELSKLKDVKFYFLPDVWACKYHPNYCGGEHDGDWVVLAIHDPYRSGKFVWLEHELIEVVTGVPDSEKSQYKRCIGGG